MTLFVFTLGHHRPSMVNTCVANLREHLTMPHRHCLLWQHYPLPNKAQNARDIRVIADRWGLELFDVGEGLGCTRGTNYLLEQVKPQPDDLILFVDPDERVVHRGFAEAMAIVVAHPHVPVCSLSTPLSQWEIAQRQHVTRSVNGQACHIPLVPIAIGVTMFHAGWFLEMGGYPETGLTTGGLEVALWGRFAKTKTALAVLADYWVVPWNQGQADIDQAYLEWKTAHRHGGLREEFEPWLKSRGVEF